jgi:two-component system response regulator
MATIDLKTLLGMAIKAHRASLGISQEELAYRAGLHRTYVSDLERGVRNPSVDSIGKIAHALEVSVSSLFQGAGELNGTKQLVEILLVEDNPRDVELTKRAFQKAKITNPLHVARDGAEALDFIFASGPYAHRRSGRQPGIILLNLNLPKVSGLEVLRRIKTDKRTAHIPIVALTVSTPDRGLAECRRLGVAAYIVKPVGFENFSGITPRLSLAWALVQNGRSARE